MRDHRPRALFWIVFATFCLGPPAVAGHTDAGTQHAHLRVMLGGHDEQEGDLPIDRLLQRYEGTLETTSGEAGRSILSVQVPLGSDLVRFEVPGSAETEAEVVVQNATRYAILSWADSQTAPAPGTEVHDVHLSFRRQVDLEEVFTVRWELPHPLSHATVRVEAPNAYTLGGGGDLVQLDAGHAPQGRAVWSTTNASMQTLEFSLHPPPTQTDPALAVPPSPFLPWLILFGIALVSGGAWAVAKRMEQRREGTAQDT